MKNLPLVIDCTGLFVFMEVCPPPSLVCLMASSRDRSGRDGIGWRDYQLTLTADRDGRIYRLHRQVSTSTANGELWTEEGKILAKAWPTFNDIVRAFLEKHGYTVVRANHSIPTDMAPVNAEFECVTWDSELKTFVVAIEVE